MLNVGVCVGNVGGCIGWWWTGGRLCVLSFCSLPSFASSSLLMGFAYVVFSIVKEFTPVLAVFEQSADL